MRDNKYSIINFVMDVVMVASIVIFLNVTMEVGPRIPILDNISGIQKTITDMYRKMYVRDLELNDVTLISSSAASDVEVCIGDDPEEDKTLPASSVPSGIRSAVYEVAKQQQYLDSNTTPENINVADIIRRTSVIKTYYNGVEQDYVTPKGFVHNDAYPYDISLTTIMPIDHIGDIINLSSYWSGPINVCVYAESYDEASSRVKQMVSNNVFKDKVSLVVVYSDFHDIVYPINVLKNIAISTVFTTHFIMIDYTMLPSTLLYDTLRKIPVSVLYEPINLVTIPVFYTNDLENAQKDIKSCIQSKKCFPKDIHMMETWFSDDNEGFYMRAIDCMEQEAVPVFLRRHNSFDTLYDESFVTRGFDEVSMVQYLRRDGYIFHILLGGYFIDTSTSIAVETKVLQHTSYAKEQYQMFLHDIVRSKTRKNADCVGERPVAAIFKDYAEMVNKDKTAQENEENTLAKTFKEMVRTDTYNVLMWNRKLAALIEGRKKRMGF